MSQTYLTNILNSVKVSSHKSLRLVTYKGIEVQKTITVAQKASHSILKKVLNVSLFAAVADSLSSVSLASSSHFDTTRADTNSVCDKTATTRVRNGICLKSKFLFCRPNLNYFSSVAIYSPNLFYFRA